MKHRMCILSIHVQHIQMTPRHTPEFVIHGALTTYDSYNKGSSRKELDLVTI